MLRNNLLFIILVIFIFGCKNTTQTQIQTNKDTIKEQSPQIYIKKVKLSTNLNDFTENEKQIIKDLMHVADFADSMFFYENYENYRQVLDTLTDSVLREKFIYNFGPWERFNNDKPFIKGVGPKKEGGNFYPNDISRMEFYEYQDSCKYSPYTFIRRNKEGKLYCLPYHVKFKNYIDSIDVLLNNVINLTDNKDFAEFLKQRISDFRTDDYYKSDSMWIGLNTNKIDFIIGPVYVNDDKFMNLKAEHQSFVLIKDQDWTMRVGKYNKWLKFLQKTIPVPVKYRAEDPGDGSNIVVYDAIYYGGSAKAGGTLISEIFPLNPKIQLSQGVKNMQFKNVIKFKFDAIAKPLSELVLFKNQSALVTADAFFENTILYEMANSLGIRNTVNGKGSVRRALKNYFSMADYIKTYSLALFLVDKLDEVNEISSEPESNYYTFVVDLLRLIRFGTENDYAKVNLIIYNYFVENKAIEYRKGRIVINYEKMKESNIELIKKIIIWQGNGDIDAIKSFIKKYNYEDEDLKLLIKNINDNKIPTDISVEPDYSIFK